MTLPKWKPFIPVTLISSTSALKRYLLVDSGADITLIPKEAGKEMGFALKEGEDIKSNGGVGSSLPVVYRELKLQIGVFEFNAPVA